MGSRQLRAVDSPGGYPWPARPICVDAIALAAIQAADLIVCPTVPDLLNLAPLQGTVALIESADKLGAAVGVVNNVDESGAARKIEHAKGVLTAFKMAVAPTAPDDMTEFARWDGCTLALINELRRVLQQQR
jgi:hypothetical protein